MVNLPGLLCDRDLKKEVFEERKNENFEENKASVTQANEAMGEQPPLVPLISKICSKYLPRNFNRIALPFPESHRGSKYFTIIVVRVPFLVARWILKLPVASASNRSMAIQNLDIISELVKDKKNLNGHHFTVH